MSLKRLRNKVRLRLLEASHSVESLIRRQRSRGQSGRDDIQIIADLQTEGVHVTTIERLLPQSAPAMRSALESASVLLRDESAREVPALWSRGVSSTDLRADVLLARIPALYLLGLDAGVLGMVGRYLQMPVAYHGAVLRHSLVDCQNEGPRLWHQDAEDFHVVRMVVYLNDVTLGGGPFEYIPRNLGISYKDFLGDQHTLTNERMQAAVPTEHWRRCIGPTGTVVIADTAQTFHHESLQTERDRAVIMIGYSTRRPKGMELATAHFPVERVTPALKQIVAPDNYGHVFDWRRAQDLPMRQRSVVY